MSGRVAICPPPYTRAQQSALLMVTEEPRTAGFSRKADLCLLHKWSHRKEGRYGGVNTEARGNRSYFYCSFGI